MMRGKPRKLVRRLDIWRGRLCRPKKISGGGDELWRIVRLRDAPARLQFDAAELVFQSESFRAAKAQPEMLNLGLFLGSRRVESWMREAK